MSRADRFTVVWKKPVYYSDFLMNFDKNPNTGQLALALNEQAIANAVKQLLLTINYERFYSPQTGTKIQAMLFENFTPQSKDLLQSTIEETIRNTEPRAKVEDLQIDPRPDNNAVQILLTISAVNIPEPITLSILIPRVR